MLKIIKYIAQVIFQEVKVLGFLKVTLVPAIIAGAAWLCDYIGITWEYKPIWFWGIFGLLAVLFIIYLLGKRAYFLQEKLSLKTNRKSKIAKIRELYSAGIAINSQHHKITCEKDWEAWRDKYDFWVHEMGETMKEVDENLHKLFWERHKYNVAKHPPFSNQNYNTKRFQDQYYIICDRLDEIADYLKKETELEQQRHYAIG